MSRKRGKQRSKTQGDLSANESLFFTSTNVSKLSYQRVTYPNNGVYEGYMRDGIREGEGTFENLYGKYIGNWANDVPCGKGVRRNSSGDRYEGDYENGKRHGKGVYTWFNGDKFNGQWKDGFMHGNGKVRV